MYKRQQESIDANQGTGLGLWSWMSLSPGSGVVLPPRHNGPYNFSRPTYCGWHDYHQVCCSRTHYSIGCSGLFILLHSLELRDCMAGRRTSKLSGICPPLNICVRFVCSSLHLRHAADGHASRLRSQREVSLGVVAAVRATGACLLYTSPSPRD